MTDGTRFLLYPQYASGYADPEIVELSPPRGSVAPGPSDHQFYTVLPLDKREPYDPPIYMPPYGGPRRPPVRPSRTGNFDHITLESEDFPAVHLYGCARWVLDIWQHYFGREITWWHAPVRPRIELVPLVQWDNAHSGPGFIETGFRANRQGRLQPFSLNFDVIAHEVGHAILFSELGVPQPERLSGAYLALQESFSDLIALISALHFDSVVDRLLIETEGNLYTLNLVSRIGEISHIEEIRTADNLLKMRDLAGLYLGPGGEWIDETGGNRNAHTLAQPLTGAIFDCFVDIVQEDLVRSGAIPPDLDARGWTREEVEASLARIQRESARSLARFYGAFRDALRDATDVVARCMVAAIKNVDPDTLTFEDIAYQFIRESRKFLPGQTQALVENFLWRDIVPEPPRPALPCPTGRVAYATRVRAAALAKQMARSRATCGCQNGRGFIAARLWLSHPERVEMATDGMSASLDK